MAAVKEVFCYPIHSKILSLRSGAERRRKLNRICEKSLLFSNKLSSVCLRIIRIGIFGSICLFFVINLLFLAAVELFFSVFVLSLTELKGFRGF